MNRFEMLSKIQEDINPRIGVEIGVQHGEYSKSILSKMPDIYLYLVDPYKQFPAYEYKDTANVSHREQEETMKQMQFNLEIYQSRCALIRKTSMDALKEIGDNSLDFVYIDGNHDYSHTLEDITKWMPKLKVGGVMAGHDYINMSSPELLIQTKMAVDDYTKLHKIMFEKTEEQFASWYFTKEREYDG